MRQRVLNCLTDKGVTDASFGPNGTLSIPGQPADSSISAGQRQQFVSTCSSDVGQPVIEAPEFNVRVNLNHRNINELCTQYSIYNKTVGLPFTTQGFTRTRESRTSLDSALPFIDST